MQGNDGILKIDFANWGQRLVAETDLKTRMLIILYAVSYIYKVSEKEITLESISINFPADSATLKYRMPRGSKPQIETANSAESNHHFPDVLPNMLLSVMLIYAYCVQNNIEPYKSFVEHQEGAEDGGLVVMLSAAYYFAKHAEIDIMGKDGFPRDGELFDIFRKMDAFYKQETFEKVDAFIDAFLAEYGQDTKPIYHGKSKRITSIGYPLDKVNSSIWGLLQLPANNGQIGFHVEKRGSDNPLLILFSIDFSAMEEAITESGGKITRNLSNYDKRVCMAAGSLFNDGQDIFSLKRLYMAMGNIGSPGKSDNEKMKAALTKLNGAQMTLNNSAEIDAGYKYPKVDYHGSIAPNEFVTAEIDGVITDSAVHLFREPPILSFARQRKQCTTISLKTLQSPISQTETGLAIEDYLIERIAREKKDLEIKKRTLNKLQRKKADNRTIEDIQRIETLKDEIKKPVRLLRTTIFEHARISTEKKPRQRAAVTITKLLDHYTETGFITCYTSDKQGYDLNL